jgi:hypothetical protein
MPTPWHAQFRATWSSKPQERQQDILDTAVLEIAYHLKPELGAFVLRNPHARNDFGTIDHNAKRNVNDPVASQPFIPDLDPDRVEENRGAERSGTARSRCACATCRANADPASRHQRQRPARKADGPTYYSAPKDALRRRGNGWIRGAGPFDAMTDYGHILAEAFDSGDHLHPGDDGTKATARSHGTDRVEWQTPGWKNKRRDACLILKTDEIAQLTLD